MSAFTEPELADLTGQRRLASTNPWRPRAVEVRGRAEAISEPEAMIRIHPGRVISWGLDSDEG